MSPKDDNSPLPTNLNSFFVTMYNMIDGPVTWVKKSIVEPNQKDYNWYHRRFRRVPTIDKCYTDDPLCKFEADQQFRRDKMVDNEIIGILRQRYEDCVHYQSPDVIEYCKPLMDMVEEASTNWFIKYGDLGGYGKAEAAYRKQQNRLIWERRHGPVGSGMKSENKAEE